MYDASLKSAGGANIQVTTKSGTNQVHGSLHDYLRKGVFATPSTYSAMRNKNMCIGNAESRTQRACAINRLWLPLRWGFWNTSLLQLCCHIDN